MMNTGKMISIFSILFLLILFVGQAQTAKEGHNWDANVVATQPGNTVVCEKCHLQGHADIGAVEFVPSGDVVYDRCFQCHNPTGDAPTKVMIGNHNTAGSVDCGFCHELHDVSTNNELTSTNVRNGQTNKNRSYVRSNMQTAYMTKLKGPNKASTNNVFQSKPNDFAFAKDSKDTIDPVFPYNGVCQSCHLVTKFHSQAAQDSPGNSDHKIATNCTICHQHAYDSLGNNDAFVPYHPDSHFGWNQACQRCHSNTEIDAGSAPEGVVSFVHGFKCELCHSDPNAPTAANATVNGTNGNASLAAGAAADSFNQSNWTCNTCHTSGEFHGYQIANVASRHDITSDASKIYGCQECHSIADPTNPTLEVDQLTAHMPADNSAVNCATNCHNGISSNISKRSKINNNVLIKTDTINIDVNPNNFNCENCHAKKGDFTMHGMSDDDGEDDGIDNADFVGWDTVTYQVSNHNNLSSSTTDTAVEGKTPAYTGKLAGAYGGLKVDVYSCDDCHSSNRVDATSLEAMQAHTPRGGGSGSCLTCHKAPADFVAIINANHDQATTPGLVRCEDCHNDTINSGTNLKGASLNSPSGKAMYQYDGLRHHTTAQAQAGNCTWCHADPRPDVPISGNGYASTCTDASSTQNVGAPNDTYDTGWGPAHGLSCPTVNGSAGPLQPGCRLCHTNYGTDGAGAAWSRNTSGGNGNHGYNIAGYSGTVTERTTGLTVYQNNFNAGSSGASNNTTVIVNATRTTQTPIHRIDANNGTDMINVYNYGACMGCHSVQIMHAAPVPGTDYPTWNADTCGSIPWDTLRYSPGRAVFNRLRGGDNNTQAWDEHRLTRNGKALENSSCETRGKDYLKDAYGNNNTTPNAASWNFNSLVAHNVVTVPLNANVTNPDTQAGSQAVYFADIAAPSIPGTVIITTADATVSEGVGTVTITARRLGGDSGAVTATLDAPANQGSTATIGAGNDFTLSSSVFSWADGESGDKTITITVNDDASTEPDETVVLTIISTTGSLVIGSPVTVTTTITDNDNNLPVAVDDAYTVAPSSTTALDVVADNDTDADADPLCITGFTAATGGTASIIDAGACDTQMQYIAPATEGVYTFTYTITDGTANDTATVTMTVDNGVNDTPVAVNDSYSVDVNSTGNSFTVMVNDSDPDPADTISITAVANPSVNGGTVTTDGNTVTYAPANCSEAADSFTYTISDDGAPVKSATATVNVTINANAVPTVVGDSSNVNLLGTIIVNVLANDSDDGPNALTITAVNDPTPGTGTIVNNGNNISYTDTQNLDAATDTFTYTVSDGCKTNTGTVNITVVANAPPVCGPTETATMIHDGSQITLTNVLAGDTDGGDGGALSVTAVDNPTTEGGAASVSGSDVLYTPPANWAGAAGAGGNDIFYYTLDDTFSTVQCEINVTITNNVPVATANTYIVLTGSTNNVLSVVTDDTGAGVDSDGDGDQICITGVTVAASAGTATVIDAGACDTQISYDAPGVETPGVTFTYEITDGVTGSTDTAVVTVNVLDNQAPVANLDSYTVLQDSVSNVFYVKANDTDADSDPITLVSCGDSGPTNGSVVKTGETCVYTPTGGYVGTDSFTYTISDGSVTSTGTVDINVLCVPGDVTQLGSWATYVDTTGGNNDNTGTGIPQFTVPTGTDTNRILLVAVSMELNGNANDTTISATYGTIGLTPIDQAPGGTNNSWVHTWMGYLLDADIPTGNNELRVSWNIAGSDTLNSAHVKWATFDYVDQTTPIVDNLSDSNTGNDRVDTTSSLTYVDKGMTMFVCNNRATGDNPTINRAGFTETVQSQDSHQSVIYQSGNHTAGGNYGTGTRCDWNSGTNGTTITGVSLRPFACSSANTAPTAVDDTATVIEDSTDNVIDVLGNDSDSDGDSLAVTDCGTASSGTVSVAATNGSCIYTPNANVCGTDVDSFIYTVEDGAGGTSTATATITVTCVDDPPVFGSPTYADTVTEGVAFSSTVAQNQAADIDGPARAYTRNGGTCSGGIVVAGADGTISGTPQNGDMPSCTVIIRATSNSLWDEATVTLTVNANAVPVPADDTGYSVQPGSGTTQLTGLLGNDSDGGDGGTLSIISASVTNLSCTAGTGHSVAMNIDGVSVDFTAPNAEGTCTFDYKINDTFYDSAVAATVTVSISNDRIVACAANWTPGVSGTNIIAVADQWNLIDSGTNNISGTASVSAVLADEPLMVVAVTAEYGSAPGGSGHVVSCNGTNLTPIVWYGSQRQTAWLGYLKGADAVACDGQTISVNDQGSPSRSDLFQATYTKVDQTTPISGSDTGGSGGANNISFSLPVVNQGYAFYAHAMNGATSTQPTGFSEHYDQDNYSADYSFAIGSMATTSTTTINDNVDLNNSERTGLAIASVRPSTLPPSNATLDVLAANSTGLSNPVTATYNSVGYAMSHVAGNQWEMVGVTDTTDTYVATITITSTGDATGMTCPVTNNASAPTWPTIAITHAEWDGVDNVDVWTTSTWDVNDQLYVDYDGSGPVEMTWNGVDSRWEHQFTGYATFVAGNATVTSNASSNSPQVLAVVDSTAVPPFTAWNEPFSSYANGGVTRDTWSNWQGMNPNSYSGCSQTGAPPAYPCTPWTILDGQTASYTNNAGPTQGATGANTKFIYTEGSASGAAYGVDMVLGDINYLESIGTLDASKYDFTLTYRYNMNFNAQTTGTHTLQVWNGLAWNPIGGTTVPVGGITGDQHNSTTWATNVVDLSGFSNADLAIRIQIQAGTTGGEAAAYDFGIDEVQVTGTIK